MTLQEFIQSHGYNFTPLEIDGTFHEFHDSLGNKGWYVGSVLSSGKITFSFGDWRNPTHTFSFINNNNLTAEEQLENERLQEKFKTEKTERQETAKKIVQDLITRWGTIGSDGESEYLKRKNLPQRIPGTIVKPTNVGGRELIVPLRDEHGEIWNFQTIFDDGSKSFFNFGRVAGLYFEFPGQEKTVVCEGFGTGAAIHYATGFKVLAATTLGNLKRVVEKFPEASIASDFDGSTEKKMRDAGHSDPHNPGVREAARLAREFKRELFLPVTDFKSEESVDFCDLWVSDGKELVKQFMTTAVDPLQFTEPMPAPKVINHKNISIVAKWINGLEPLSINTTKSGKPLLPEEVEVAKKLYDYWEGKLIKSNEGDIFNWTGKVWRACDKQDEQNWLQQIMVLHAGYGTNSRFVSVLKIFLSMIPFTTRNLFAPNPYRITFNNGTLCIDFVSGKWEMTFRPHSKADYCVNLIQHDYDEANQATNQLFEETLQNILGDDEFPAKRRAVAQLFGSCLAPVYPRLFLLVGKTGSGKSTLTLLASKLVTEGNIASVQPCDFQGFLMESMVGKLVNMVTDIDFTKPISDAVIKQIEDRVPIMINRKNKLAVRAPFPAVHVFGANDIPPTLERGSMAHTRRWTFIPCNYFQRDIADHDKHRIDKIMDAGMQGIINFAVEGLKDLLESQGHFFVPDSGREKMRKWQVQNDPIQSFFEAIRDGEVPDLTLDPNGKCFTKVLWEHFVAWHQDAYNARPRVSKMRFFEKVVGNLGAKSKYDGHWIFRGVESKTSPVFGRGAAPGVGREKEIPHESVEPGNSLPDAGRKLLENSNALF